MNTLVIILAHIVYGIIRTKNFRFMVTAAIFRQFSWSWFLTSSKLHALNQQSRWWLEAREFEKDPKRHVNIFIIDVTGSIQILVLKETCTRVHIQRLMQ